MDGDDVHAEPSGDSGNGGIDVLVEEKTHRELLVIAGFQEGKLLPHPLGCQLRLALQASVDLGRVQLVVGEGGSKLGLGQPGIAPPEVFITPAAFSPGGDDLPDVEPACQGGATTGCTVNEHDS